MGNYEIRILSREEIEQPLIWAREEGWNPGKYDAESFYQADKEGFLGGFLDGELIATISAIRYGKTFGFLGFYIVKKEYRGQGYGWQIWQKALEHLADRNIGLDGVVEQQANYQKSGFQLAYRNIRYQGISQKLAVDQEVINLADVPFSVINNFDRLFFPEDRTKFLQSWLNQPENYVMGVIEAGEILGYGMIRPCHIGYKIGPLFAQNALIAENIWRSLQSSLEIGTTYYLDIPEINPFARNLVDQYELNIVFETARMYNQTVPLLPIEQIFGVTSFELG